MIFKYIFLILMPTMFINSCYQSTEWEDVNSDYDPVLNVIGIISLDENIDSFVGVYRTTELTEISLTFTGIVDTNTWYDYERDTVYTWLDSLYAPAGLIDSAAVTITNGVDSTVFNFSDEYSHYTSDAFIPMPETTYFLTIEVNGFDPVSGELTTPSVPLLDDLQIPDTLSAGSAYEITWSNNQNSAEKGLLTGNLIDSFVRCGGEFYEEVDLKWGTTSIYPQWCDFGDISLGDIDNDYGLKTQSQCICDDYRLWNTDSQNCLCDDGNPPVFEDNNEAVKLFGDCESAVNEFGCLHTFDGDTYLFEYCPISCGGCEFMAGISETACEEGLYEICPETCGVCDAADLEPLNNRIWTMLDSSNIENDGFINHGYCGDGNPDSELLQIRLLAMDENYYRYFAAENYKEFSNFLFETGGTAGHSIGIEGGFGVFGSFASDKLLRVLSP